MENKEKALILAGLARDIGEEDTKRALGLKDQKPVMLNLRSLGFSFEEIGSYYGRTRAWAANLLPEGDRAAPQIIDRPDPDKIALAIWVESAEDLTWWGAGSRLLYEKMVDRFRDYKYSWNEARAAAKKYSISKLDVIMLVSFQVVQEDQKEWFQGLLESHTKAAIFQKVNKGQPLQVRVRSFNRVWSDFGLRSPHRAKTRFEHQFREIKKNL